MGTFKSYLDASRDVLAAAATAIDEAQVERAIASIHAALVVDKPLLICGNGGSAADAMHIAGELVGRYKKERRALKAMALVADPAVITAWSNDYSYDSAFARQVEASGEAGDRHAVHPASAHLPLSLSLRRDRSAYRALTFS